jgi:hypothetical protein
MVDLQQHMSVVRSFSSLTRGIGRSVLCGKSWVPGGAYPADQKENDNKATADQPAQARYHHVTRDRTRSISRARNL